MALRDDQLIDIAGRSYDHQPSIAVIGGGTGAYTALTGLKRFTSKLTAIISMADSGGSTGRLRDEFGHLPPGDLRKALVALAPDDDASLMLRRLFEYRFERGGGLTGHTFGNLFLTALTEITGGTEHAVEEASHILNIRGRVAPVTLDDTHLMAKTVNGDIIWGPMGRRARDCIQGGSRWARRGCDRTRRPGADDSVQASGWRLGSE